MMMKMEVEAGRRQLINLSRRAAESESVAVPLTEDKDNWQSNHTIDGLSKRKWAMKFLDLKSSKSKYPEEST